MTMVRMIITIDDNMGFYDLLMIAASIGSIFDMAGKRLLISHKDKN